MKTPNTEEMRERLQSSRKFYDLLINVLVEIEHLDEVSIDSLIDPIREPFRFVCLDQVQWEFSQGTIPYIALRAAGKHKAPIEFRKNLYPSYAQLVVSLAQDALGWIDDLVYYEFDRSSNDVQDHLTNLPATKSEVKSLRLETLLEHSWVEGVIHQVPHIPEMNEDQQETKDGPAQPYTWIHHGQPIENEMNELAWYMVNYLWTREGKIAKWEDLAEPVYGDREHDTSGDAIPSLRKKANHFFDRHEIPWRVTAPEGKARLINRIVKKTLDEPG